MQVAIALLGRSEVVILDEPTCGEQTLAVLAALVVLEFIILKAAN